MIRLALQHFCRKAAIIRAFCLILFCCFMQIVQAQKDSVNLREFVFTGTLKEMRKDDLAIPVEIYPQSYFIRNNVSNLSEAMTMISGVQANLDGSIDGANDIEINGQEGIYTLITIDGLPVSGGNNNVYGLVGIPMAIIDRIEVIKGPASTIYGSDAVSGIVNVITKNPEHTSKFFGDVKYSSYNDLNAEAGFKIPAGKANGLITASLYQMGSHWDKDHDGYTDQPLTTRVSLFSKWTFRNKYKKLSSVFGRYVYEDRMGGQIAYSRQWLGSDSVYGESIRTNRFEVYGNFLLPIKKENVSVQVSYTDHKQEAWYGYRPFNNQERNGRVQLLYDNRVGGISDLMIGAMYKLYWYKDQLSNVDTTGTPHPLVNHFVALFIQDMIHINQSNEVLAGLRYEYNSLYKGNAICPRFDYKWTSPKRMDFVRFGLGSGFRTPNVFADDRYGFVNNKKIVINGDIKTELSYGAHLSYERKIEKNGIFNIEANGFFNGIINKIEVDRYSHPDAVIYSNDGSFNLNYGINVNTDLQFKFPLKARIGFTAMVNHNFHKNDEGLTVYDNVINAPAFTANYVISYSFDKPGISIDWSGVVNSPMYLNVTSNDYRRDQSPWYCLMNLQVTKKFKFGLDIYAGGSNLLNFRPHDLILRGNDPFNKYVSDLDNNPHNYRFDASYIYAPNQGIKGYVGVRWHID
jgi:outer membrane receptor for ferrienterochelin and colicins